MADSFTQFSCLFDLDSGEDAEQAMKLYQDMKLEYGEQCEDVGFSLSIDDDDPAVLWIWSDGYGDTNHVSDFVRRCGDTFGLTGLWGFEWANTCSSPALDGFSGGACVIDLATGEEIGAVSTNQWLSDFLKTEADRAASR